jgi:hypothetical protein
MIASSPIVVIYMGSYYAKNMTHATFI